MIWGFSIFFQNVFFWRKYGKIIGRKKHLSENLGKSGQFQTLYFVEVQIA